MRRRDIIRGSRVSAFSLHVQTQAEDGCTEKTVIIPACAGWRPRVPSRDECMSVLAWNRTSVHQVVERAFIKQTQPHQWAAGRFFGWRAAAISGAFSSTCFIAFSIALLLSFCSCSFQTFEYQEYNSFIASATKTAYSIWSMPHVCNKDCIVIPSFSSFHLGTV